MFLTISLSPDSFIGKTTSFHPIHLEIGGILAELPDFLAVVTLHFDEMVDVRTINELILHCLQVLKFAPDIGTVRQRTLGCMAMERENDILPSGLAVDACHSIVAVLSAKPFALVDQSCLAVRRFLRERERSAVPEQLRVFVFGMPHAKVNLPHLRARLVDSGFLDEAEPFDLETLKAILNKRFDEIDYASAKEDVRSFIRDKASLDLWSANFFKQMTEQLEGQ